MAPLCRISVRPDRFARRRLSLYSQVQPQRDPSRVRQGNISQPLFSPTGLQAAVRCPSKIIVLKTQKHFSPVEPCLKSAFCMYTHRQESIYSLWLLPWYNCNGWLGVNHQLIYLLTYLLTLPLLLLLSGGDDDDGRKKSRHIVMFKMAWRKRRRKRWKHNEDLNYDHGDELDAEEEQEKKAKEQETMKKVVHDGDTDGNDDDDDSLMTCRYPYYAAVW